MKMTGLPIHAIFAGSIYGIKADIFRIVALQSQTTNGHSSRHVGYVGKSIFV